MKDRCIEGSAACRTQYAIEGNPYQSLVIDITNRCNMTCNFCYNPVRLHQDMSLEHFNYICAHLPFPTVLKLCGGEPTLHPGIIDFISIAHRHGHMVHIVSNGIRYTDRGFMNSLKELRKKAVFSMGISMDGGCGNRHAYKTINGADCLEQKLDAFRSLISYRLGRVGLAAIIVRGLNEDVISQLVVLAKKHHQAVRWLHFRNAGKVGSYLDTEPYSIYELKELVRPNFSEEEFKPKCVHELHCPPESGNECCYRFRPTERLQVSIIEFDSEKSVKCPKRGRITIGEHVIRPFFESMR